MKTPSRSTRLLFSLVAMAGLGAQGPQQPQPPQPGPRFAGKSIPDPPRQKEPWTPPETKLPRFLVAATQALFEQGLADPRGCEYREVEVFERPAAKTRAFVLPVTPGESVRFAVGWDGTVFPVSSVGAAADLDADIRALGEPMRGGRDEPATAKVVRRGNAAGFVNVSGSGFVFDAGGTSFASDRLALKLCLLLRLGRADLAEALFAAGTTWTPELRGRDLTDYHISYLTLAREWAARMYLRAVDAHARGDDAIALDAARRLSAFAAATKARALEMGFERENVQIGNDPPSYLPFLRQLPEILADQERRAREGPRGPVPPPGSDPAARVAALIRDLDQVAIPEQFGFGNNGGGSPLVGALIAEGDAAVEPLLAAIESDTRLNRTVNVGRGMRIDRRVQDVFEAEFTALNALLKTQQFSGMQYPVQAGTASRKDLARSMREYWMKNRALSQTERWYRMLRDDAGGFARWSEAANGIVQPAAPVRRPGVNEGPMKGEELRARRDPSVSELLAKRALGVAHAPHERKTPNVELNQACGLAMLLHRWDPKAGLPVIRTLMAEARESVERDRAEGYSQTYSLVATIARFALIRARAGEPSALAEYAAVIRGSDPEKEQPHNLDAFEPLWTYPDDPAIREAARWLFNDRASPWAGLVRKPGSNRMTSFFRTSLYASPLLRSAGFREAVLDALAIRTELGTARRIRKNLVQYALKEGVSGSFGASEDDLEGVAQGVDQKIRACDYLAWQIAAIEGAPRCELYWPDEMRDAGVEACAAFLKTYGDRFTAEPPPGERGPFFETMAYLAFPALDRPATQADVRAGRAIFSLEGSGETRRVALPSVPVRAKIVPPEDEPGAVAMEGRVWQAEEVLRDGQWLRYYGFVGRHVIARVPAGSIELTVGRPAGAGNR